MRLDVAVDDATRVQVLQPEERLGDKPARDGLVQKAEVLEQVEAVAAREEFHDHVQMLRRRKGEEEAHHVGVVGDGCGEGGGG